MTGREREKLYVGEETIKTGPMCFLYDIFTLLYYLLVTLLYYLLVTLLYYLLVTLLYYLIVIPFYNTNANRKSARESIYNTQFRPTLHIILLCKADNHSFILCVTPSNPAKALLLSHVVCNYHHL
jgi:hypothetical protein